MFTLKAPFLTSALQLLITFTTITKYMCACAYSHTYHNTKHRQGLSADLKEEAGSALEHLQRQKPLVMVVFPISLSAQSSALTLACPGWYSHRSL